MVVILKNTVWAFALFAYVNDLIVYWLQYLLTLCYLSDALASVYLFVLMTFSFNTLFSLEGLVFFHLFKIVFYVDRTCDFLFAPQIACLSLLCWLIFHIFNFVYRKKSLKIPNGRSESVYWRRTDNTMTKRKRVKGQTIYKTCTYN